MIHDEKAVDMHALSKYVTEKRKKDCVAVRDKSNLLEKHDHS